MNERLSHRRSVPRTIYPNKYATENQFYESELIYIF